MSHVWIVVAKDVWCAPFAQQDKPFTTKIIILPICKFYYSHVIALSAYLMILILHCFEDSVTHNYDIYLKVKLGNLFPRIWSEHRTRVAR